MSVVDIALGVFILVLAIRGLVRGIIKEVFGIAALIGGVVVSYMFGKQLGYAISHHITVSPVVAYTAAFFIIFLVVYSVFLLVGYVLATMIKAIQLGWLDRTLGFLFGCAKALLLIGVAAFFIANFPFLNYLNSDLKENSFIYRQTSKYIENLDMQKFMERIKRLKRKEAGKLTIVVGGNNEKG